MVNKSTSSATPLLGYRDEKRVHFRVPARSQLPAIRSIVGEALKSRIRKDTTSIGSVGGRAERPQLMTRCHVLWSPQMRRRISVLWSIRASVVSLVFIRVCGLGNSSQHRRREMRAVFPKFFFYVLNCTLRFVPPPPPPSEIADSAYYLYVHYFTIFWPPFFLVFPPFFLLF